MLLQREGSHERGFSNITCKLQYKVLYLSLQIKIFNYGTVNIINESR